MEADNDRVHINTVIIPRSYFIILDSILVCGDGLLLIFLLLEAGRETLTLNQPMTIEIGPEILKDFIELGREATSYQWLP